MIVSDTGRVEDNRLIVLECSKHLDIGRAVGLSVLWQYCGISFANTETQRAKKSRGSGKQKDMYRLRFLGVDS